MNLKETFLKTVSSQGGEMLQNQRDELLADAEVRARKIADEFAAHPRALKRRLAFQIFKSPSKNRREDRPSRKSALANTLLVPTKYAMPIEHRREGEEEKYFPR